MCIFSKHNIINIYKYRLPKCITTCHLELDLSKYINKQNNYLNKVLSPFPPLLNVISHPSPPPSFYRSLASSPSISLSPLPIALLSLSLSPLYLSFCLPPHQYLSSPHISISLLAHIFLSPLPFLSLALFFSISVPPSLSSFSSSPPPSSRRL